MRGESPAEKIRRLSKAGASPALAQAMAAWETVLDETVKRLEKLEAVQGCDACQEQIDVLNARTQELEQALLSTECQPGDGWRAGRDISDDAPAVEIDFAATEQLLRDQDEKRRRASE